MAVMIFGIYVLIGFTGAALHWGFSDSVSFDGFEMVLTIIFWPVFLGIVVSFILGDIFRNSAGWARRNKD